MKYEVRLSAPWGDIVPLMAVASAKAQLRATAGSTDFHKPAYDGSFTKFADDLLREAKCGRLKVCDQWGVPGESDALIADAKQTGDLIVVRRYVIEPDWERLRRENEPIAPGVWNLAHLDLGPSEVDWTRTHLSALCTTLKWLNEWGASRGDEFTVTHEGLEWADERGIHRPKRAAAATEAAHTPAERRTTDTAPVQTRRPSNDDAQPARLRIQQEATEEWIRWLATGGNPTVHAISERLAQWCASNDVRTAGKVNPRAGTIRNTILGAGHWTPPGMSREKAKEHVAQVAHAHVAHVARDKG